MYTTAMRLPVIGTLIGAMSLFLLFPLFSFGHSSVFAAVVINEIYPKPNDETSEWIELYNNGSESVSLNEWKLENTEGEKTSFIIPASRIIAPNGFLTFPRSETNIKLNDIGDTVSLYDIGNTRIDSQSFPSTLGVNTSVGRSTDGGGSWVICTTPATQNLPNNCPAPTSTPIPTPTMSPTNTPIPTEIPPPTEIAPIVIATPPTAAILGAVSAPTPTHTPTPFPADVLGIEIPKIITISRMLIIQILVVVAAWVLLAMVARWRTRRKHGRRDVNN